MNLFGFKANITPVLADYKQMYTGFTLRSIQ